MKSVLTKPLERPRLRVAILCGDPLRSSALAAIVREAGHSLCEAAGEADVVVADGAVQPPDHAAVVRVCDFEDDEVAGTLAEGATPVQIIAAIEALAAGLSVRMRRTPHAGFGAVLEPKLQYLLTAREFDVLAALAEGLSNKAIARKLDISQHTVKFHIESLFRKLGVRSRSQAVAKGLTSMSRTKLEL